MKIGFKSVFLIGILAIHSSFLKRRKESSPILIIFYLSPELSVLKTAGFPASFRNASFKVIHLHRGY